MRFLAQLVGDAAELYLYDEIGGWGTPAKAFVEQLDGMRAAGAKRLNLYLNSPGGDVFDGAAIYAAIKRFPGARTVHVDGLAASIASVVAMAGDTIKMSPGSMMMIHEPWGFAQGTADKMRATADVLDKLGDTIQATYAKRTKRPVDEIEKLMSAETWLTADEAVRLGFADAVVSRRNPSTGQSTETTGGDGSGDGAEVDDLAALGAWPSFGKFTRAPVEARALLARGLPLAETAATGRATQSPPRAEKEKPVMDEENKGALEAKATADKEAAATIKALENRIASIEARTKAVASDPSAELVAVAARKAPGVLHERDLHPDREERSDAQAQNMADLLLRGDTTVPRMRSAAQKAAAQAAAPGGLDMARTAAAIARSRDVPGMTYAEAAANLGFRRTAEMLARNAAMLEGDATKGGVFVPTDVQKGFIDSLHHLVAVRPLIPEANVIRSSSMTMQFSRLTNNFTAEQVAEGSAGSTGPQALTTDYLTATAKKMRIETLISRQLLRDAQVNVDQIVNQKLALSAALAEDLLIVEGDGTANTPRGLKHWAPSGTALAAANSDTSYVNARTDLRSLIKKMATDKVPASFGRAFVGAEIHRWGLGDMYNNFQIFPFEQQLEQGKLLGIDAAFSTQLNTTGAASCFYAFAPGAAIFFEHLGMLIELDSMYVDSSGVSHSASGRDETVIRLWRSFDFLMQHPEAVEYLSTVTWGA